MLTCDHASHAVPESLGNLGLDSRDLERHIGWDIGAAEVTRRLAERFDAPAVLSGYSRLVIDCNRKLGSETSILEVSDGTVIPGNLGLRARGYRTPRRGPVTFRIMKPFRVSYERISRRTGSSTDLRRRS